MVYQIGCHTAPNDGRWLRPLAKTTANCGLINPSFEAFAVAGRVLGWDFGVATTDRDGRAAMSLDTLNPKHGRHALRVVVPTATPLVFPFTSTHGTSQPNFFVSADAFSIVPMPDRFCVTRAALET